MSDTQSTPVISDTKPRKAKNRRIVVLMSALIILVAIALGSAAGYAQGVGTRISIQQTSESKSMAEQFALAEKDFAEKKYANARVRLDYILEKNQGYPGAVELLTKLMVDMSITPTLTPTIVPSATPTADTRAVELIFNQAQEQVKNSDWTNALASLDQLRKNYPQYKAVEVDGMYYISLRNRGMDQIIGNRAYAETTNMEGGIYDLTLAERFGPLDGVADGTRNGARMYIIGASFWDLNWEQAVYYFSLAADQLPYLRDASNMTSTQRYYQALLKYGDIQFEKGNREKERCMALETWDRARSVGGSLNEEYTYKYDVLFLRCFPPTEIPVVDTPVVEPPVEEPTATVGP